MTKQISTGRKASYYIGMVMIVAGFLVFASNFLIIGSSVANPSQASAAPVGFMARALGGMALIVVGAFVRRMGARGLAGSGVVLNPSQARRDLEPFSRMAGGMLDDALSETDVKLGKSGERVVMIRCSSCKTLNEEGSKFCQECGKLV